MKSFLDEILTIALGGESNYRKEELIRQSFMRNIREYNTLIRNSMWLKESMDKDEYKKMQQYENRKAIYDIGLRSLENNDLKIEEIKPNDTDFWKDVEEQRIVKLWVLK